VSLDASGDPIITAAADGGVRLDAPPETTPAAGADGQAPGSEGPSVGPTPAAEDAQTGDIDADGVPDARDACPATLPGTDVDRFGCAVVSRVPVARIGAIAGGVALLFVLGGLIARRARGVPLIDRDVEVPISELWPPAISDQEFVGQTIRFVHPDTGTLQLMPGRLEVTGGDDAGQVIRLVRVPGAKVEMTFGRSPGSGPSHIQFKEQTVSRRHATIRLRDDDWWLQNFSSTNPTVLNGDVLGSEEVPLADSDQIEMGEVTFRFRTS
jgi:hypothetical protein